MFAKGLLPSCLLFALCVKTGAAQNAVSPDGRTALLNGTRLWYKVAGHASPGTAPLLFLHGGPGLNSYGFEHTIGNRLEDHLQVIYLDQRGAGRSDRPVSKDYAMSTLVEDVEALRKALGIPKLSLMGHSFGGPIALEYASRYPDHVAKLIIVAGAVDMPDAFQRWQTLLETKYPLAWGTAVAGPEGQSLRAAEAGTDTCYIAKQRARLVMATVAKVGPQDFRNMQQFHNKAVLQEQQDLDAHSGLHTSGEFMQAYFSPGNDFYCYRFTAFKRLTMPVLVLGGKYDGSVDFLEMKQLSRNILGSVLVGFEDSGHYPYAEEPIKFEQVVSGFLSPH